MQRYSIFFILVLHVTLFLSAEESNNSLFDVFEEVDALKAEQKLEYDKIAGTDTVYIEKLNITINDMEYNSKDMNREIQDRPGNAVVGQGSTLAVVMRWIVLREQDSMTLAEVEKELERSKNRLERGSARFDSVEYNIRILSYNKETQSYLIAIYIHLSDGFRWSFWGGKIYAGVGIGNIKGKGRDFSTTLGYNKVSFYFRDNQLANLGKNEQGFGKGWLFYDVLLFHKWETPLLSASKFSYHKIGIVFGLGLSPHPTVDIGFRLAHNYSWLDNNPGKEKESWKLPGSIHAGSQEFTTTPFIRYLEKFSFEHSSSHKLLQGEHSLYVFFVLYTSLGVLINHAEEEQNFTVKGELLSDIRYRYQLLIPNILRLQTRFGVGNRNLRYNNAFSVAGSNIDTGITWARRNTYPYEISYGYTVFLLKLEYILRIMNFSIISVDLYGFADYGGTSMQSYPLAKDWRLVPGVGTRLNIQAPVYLSFDLAFGFGSHLLGYSDGSIWSWLLNVTINI